MLKAISPIDGRYANQTKVCLYFSEFALIRYRVKVEFEYFVHLHSAQVGDLKKLDHIPASLNSAIDEMDESGSKIKRDRKNNQSRCKSC